MLNKCFVSPQNCVIEIITISTLNAVYLAYMCSSSAKYGRLQQSPTKKILMVIGILLTLNNVLILSVNIPLLILQKGEE